MRTELEIGEELRGWAPRLKSSVFDLLPFQELSIGSIRRTRHCFCHSCERLAPDDRGRGGPASGGPGEGEETCQAFGRR